MKFYRRKKKNTSVDTTPKVPCRVVNPNGGTYHPTKAPDGLSKCGVMLELKPRNEDYIFPSMRKAEHARHHTIKYMLQLGFELQAIVGDFVVVRT